MYHTPSIVEDGGQLPMVEHAALKVPAQGTGRGTEGAGARATPGGLEVRRERRRKLPRGAGNRPGAGGRRDAGPTEVDGQLPELPVIRVPGDRSVLPFWPRFISVINRTVLPFWPGFTVVGNRWALPLWPVFAVVGRHTALPIWPVFGKCGMEGEAGLAPTGNVGR
jgi:hypothetical protein